MRLLFDENLSQSLCRMLEDVFPDCQSVRDVGLGGATDQRVWSHALAEGFTIVSKDLDFVDRAVNDQGTVRVIWIRLGNCTTEAVHLVLRNSHERIRQFEDSDDVVLELP